jgi:hypothetical protein
MRVFDKEKEHETYPHTRFESQARKFSPELVTSVDRLQEASRVASIPSIPSIIVVRRGDEGHVSIQIEVGSTPDHVARATAAVRRAARLQIACGFRSGRALFLLPDSSVVIEAMRQPDAP